MLTCTRVCAHVCVWVQGVPMPTCMCRLDWLWEDSLGAVTGDLVAAEGWAGACLCVNNVAFAVFMCDLG